MCVYAAMPVGRTNLRYQCYRLRQQGHAVDGGGALPHGDGCRVPHMRPLINRMGMLKTIANLSPARFATKPWHPHSA